MLSLQKRAPAAHCRRMKEAIRDQYKLLREEIPEIEREKKSHRIFEAFLKLPEFETAENILVYVSKGEEVVTHFMVRSLLSSGKTIYVPKVVGDDMIACRLDHWEDLDFGAFGVLEPSEVIEIKDPSELELIMVPGVVFSIQGDRIGLGKGYYDRFLKRCPGIKVGLAYEEQIVDELPSMPHDVPMNLILTDQTLYRS